MHQLQILKSHPNARIPTRAHDGDLGFDLYACEAQVLPPHVPQLIPIGICCSFPAGFGALIKDRSSLASKGLHTLGGVIDEGYRGEIKVLIINLGDKPFSIEAGDRIAQMVPMPVYAWQTTEVTSLDDTARAAGGFGSSGR